MAATQQVKVTLPTRLKKLVDAKAKNLGLASSVYIRYLVIKDIEEQDLPTYQASSLTELSIQEGIEEYKTGKLKKYTNAKDLITSMAE